MRVLKGRLKQSPFVGVFASVSDEIGLIPKISKKQKKNLENLFGVPLLEADILETSLIGVFTKLYKKKIVVPTEIGERERRNLEKEGLEIMEIGGIHNALGNLISLNKNCCLISPLLEKKAEEISRFFGIRKTLVTKLSNLEVVGAMVFANNRGFLAYNELGEREFTILESCFGVPGDIGTLNYGDVFVSNSVVGNKNGLLVGDESSTIEIGKINEIFV